MLQLRAKFQTLMVLCSRFVMDHKLQCSQEGLNCKPRTCKAVMLWPNEEVNNIDMLV